jgi:hypothetical protein
MVLTRMHKMQLHRLLVTDIYKSDFSLNRHKQHGNRQLTSAQHDTTARCDGRAATFEALEESLSRWRWRSCRLS